MKLHHIVFGLALVGVCCAAIGCGGAGGGSRDGLVKAEGVLTYQGQPVAEAIIEMRPAAEGVTNGVAVGRTDAQGKFQMMTDRPGDGAMPGQYKTVVKKEVETIDGMTREEYTKKQEAEGKKDVIFDKSKVKVESLLPTKYSDPETTPLTVEIPAKGSKTLAIELED